MEMTFWANATFKARLPFTKGGQTKWLKMIIFGKMSSSPFEKEPALSLPKGRGILY